jgi:hypothetical protein
VSSVATRLGARKSGLSNRSDRQTQRSLFDERSDRGQYDSLDDQEAIREEDADLATTWFEPVIPGQRKFLVLSFLYEESFYRNLWRKIGAHRRQDALVRDSPTEPLISFVLVPTTAALKSNSPLNFLYDVMSRPHWTRKMHIATRISNHKCILAGCAERLLNCSLLNQRGLAKFANMARAKDLERATSLVEVVSGGPRPRREPEVAGPGESRR